MPYKAKQGFQYSIIEFNGEEVYRFKTYSEAMRIEKMLNEAYEKGSSLFLETPDSEQVPKYLEPCMFNFKDDTNE